MNAPLSQLDAQLAALPRFGECAGCGEICAHAGDGLSLCCKEKLQNLRTESEIWIDKQIERQEQESDRRELARDAYENDAYDRAGDR